MELDSASRCQDIALDTCPAPRGRWQAGFSLAVMVASVLVLLGWMLDLAPLKAPLPKAPAMSLASALALLLLGAALWRAGPPIVDRFLLGTVVILVGIASTQTLPVMSGAEVSQVAGLPRVDKPARMAPATALALLAAAASLWLAARHPRPALALAMAPGIIGALAILGYLFGTQTLHSFPPFSAMAPHTALLLVLLAAGIFDALRDHGFMRELSGPQLGARVARRMLFWSAALLLPLAWLQHTGSQAGWYGPDFGLALTILLAAMIMSFLVWQAARALNRDEARLELAQTVFDHVSEGIVVTDVQARILAVNPGFSRITGYTPEEVLGQNPRLLQSGRQGLAFYQSMWKVISQHGYWRGEVENRRKSGEIYPELLSIKAVQNAAGTVTHYLGVFADLSERLAEERRLKVLSRKLDLALEVGAIGTWYWNAKLMTLEGDSRMRSIFALDAAAAPPQTLQDWLPRIEPRDHDHLVSLLAALPGNGTTLETDIGILGDDGKRRVGALRGSGEHDPERPDEVILVLRDVSEQRAIEGEISRLNASLERRVEARTIELQAAMRELEAFSYSVAHDLRTPLRTIEGFSQVLLLKNATQLDASGRDYLERIRAAGQRMGMLIDELLQLARLSRCTLTLQTVDWSKLAHEIVGELRQGDPGRDVAVTIEPEIRSLADPALARVILGNLLSNAWKYTSHRTGATITFSRATTRRGESAYLVADDGAGFDMKFANQLFKPFHRLHHADEFPGSGIGLASVARAVERLEGQVWAESAVGEGARFYFFLAPQEKAPD